MAAHEVAALVLAAGRSSRMAPHNKLLMRDAQGHAMVARVVEAALASRASDVLVVTGHQADQVEQAAGMVGRPGRRPRVVHAEGYAAGLSASLKAGLSALPAGAEAVLVCLGDMPLVSAALLDRLIDAFDPLARQGCVVPTCQGVRGNPVLWGRRFFADIMALEGDAGARSLLRRHQADILELETGDEAVLRDFDTLDAIGRFEGSVLF